MAGRGVGRHFFLLVPGLGGGGRGAGKRGNGKRAGCCQPGYGEDARAEAVNGTADHVRAGELPGDAGGHKRRRLAEGHGFKELGQIRYRQCRWGDPSFRGEAGYRPGRQVGDGKAGLACEPAFAMSVTRGWLLSTSVCSPVRCGRTGSGAIVSVLTTPEPGTSGRGLDVSTVYVNDARPGQLQALADSIASGRLTSQ